MAPDVFDNVSTPAARPGVGRTSRRARPIRGKRQPDNKAVGPMSAAARGRISTGDAV